MEKLAPGARNDGQQPKDGRQEKLTRARGLSWETVSLRPL